MRIAVPSEFESTTELRAPEGPRARDARRRRSSCGDQITSRLPLAAMTETMQAAVYDRYGPAREVLRVAEIERPEPGPGEVRVRMRVSGVNPTDWRVRSGSQGYDAAVPVSWCPTRTAPARSTRSAPASPARASASGCGCGSPPQNRQHGSAAQWACLPQRQAVPLPDGRLARPRARASASPRSPPTAASSRRRRRRPHRARRRRRRRRRPLRDRARPPRRRTHPRDRQLRREGRPGPAAGADVVVNYRAEDAAARDPRRGPRRRRPRRSRSRPRRTPRSTSRCSRRTASSAPTPPTATWRRPCGR